MKKQHITPSDLLRVSYINLDNIGLYGDMPSWVLRMKNLRRISLKNTHIVLKNVTSLRALPYLDTLDISDNNLFKNGGTLANAFANALRGFSLTSLTAKNIRAGSSKIGNIGELRSLRELDLSRNWISSLSSLNLTNLKNLLVLNLSDNDLSGTLYTQYLPKVRLQKNSIFQKTTSLK